MMLRPALSSGSPSSHTSSPTTLLSVVAIALLSSPSLAAATLDCAAIVATGGKDGSTSHKFDLSKLGGPHTVVTTRQSGPNNATTSWTIDICKELKRKGDVPKDMRCPDGTRVCGLERLHFEKNDILNAVLPIAGDLQAAGGSDFTFEATLISPSSSKDDDKSKDRSGLRLVLGGGEAPMSEPESQRRPQRAVVDFICDAKRTGLEGEWDEGEDHYEHKRGLDRRDEGGKKATEDEDITKNHQLMKDGAALIFESYGPASSDSKMDELRLTWYTSAACIDKRDDGSGAGGGDDGSHWGFFTWLIIITFLVVASYLIFGSWLNYNRYGARGWDLLPHGDTIRDLPYLLKDWTRRVLNTVQGSGSRGGYSAV